MAAAHGGYDIERAYVEHGMSTPAIGREIGVAGKTVARRLHKLGVTLRSWRAPKLPISNAAIARAYRDEGMSVGGVAGMLGVSKTTILRRLDEMGIARRPRGGRLAGRLIPVGPGEPYVRARTREGRTSRIHRACWEAYHGPIPKGHHIHHVDGDRTYNDICNLRCMTKGEHTRVHHRREK